MRFYIFLAFFIALCAAAEFTITPQYVVVPTKARLVLDIYGTWPFPGRLEMAICGVVSRMGVLQQYSYEFGYDFQFFSGLTTLEMYLYNQSDVQVKTISTTLYVPELVDQLANGPSRFQSSCDSFQIRALGQSDPADFYGGDDVHISVNFEDNQSCARGHYFDKDLSKCIHCPNGYWSDIGAKNYTECFTD